MWLLPIFFTVAVTEGDSVQIQGKGLKASCLEIYTENLNIQSGSYVVANGGRNLSVYCDFREGNGFTFISRLNDVESSPIDIDKLANVKNRALIRACMPNYSQKDSLLFQLDEFKYINLSFQYNAANGYQEPDKNNEDMGPYIYLGFLPEVEADKKGTMQGYKAEGRNFRFVNCDGNGNSYFAFYFNPNSAMFGRTGNVDDIMIDWLQVAQHTMENNYLPNDFFFPFEIHMGGCGGFSTNASSIGVLGAALGLPFDKTALTKSLRFAVVQFNFSEVICQQHSTVTNVVKHGSGTTYGSRMIHECTDQH